MMSTLAYFVNFKPENVNFSGSDRPNLGTEGSLSNVNYGFLVDIVVDIVVDMTSAVRQYITRFVNQSTRKMPIKIFWKKGCVSGGCAGCTRNKVLRAREGGCQVDRPRERDIEAYLRRRVCELGGFCLKYSNPAETGYPDRVCLLPGGRVLWVELKTERGRLSAVQSVRFSDMAGKGHPVHVCRSYADVDRMLEEEVEP